MNKKVVVLCAIMILALASVSMAGSDFRLGTAGAQELRIPVGARGSALANSIAADVYGCEAIYYNPAGVGMIEGTEAMFTHMKYFADMDLNYFGLTTKIEDFGSIGISAKVLSVGEILKTTESASSIDGSGEIFEPTMAVLGVTYSRVLTDRVAFGITGKYINESIDMASANGFAVDFGINYDTKWNGLRLGFVVKNIGQSMAFSGEGFRVDVNVPGQNSNVSPDKGTYIESASFEIPSWVSFNAAIDFLNMDLNRGTFYGTFQSNNFSNDLYRAGVEYAYNEQYFLRAGYTLDQDQADYLYGLAFGAGVLFKFGNTNVTFEYSWNETEFFDNIQYFTGKVHF